MQRRTIVIGAGLSGLACAFDRFRAGDDVVVLEAGSRPGGVVGTFDVDGFRFERGPNTVPASAADFRTLCADLGIADRLVASSNAAQDRYLFHDGQLRVLPADPLALLSSPLLSIKAKLHLGTEPMRAWKPPPADAPESTLEELLVERIGPEPTRLFAGAFVRGVYAAELSELGAKSAFPRMWRMLEEHKSLVRALWVERNRVPPRLPGPDVPRTRLLSFPNGMQELVDALAAALGDRVRVDSAAAKIERANETWRVIAKDGVHFEAEHVVLAVPAPVAADLLEPNAPREIPLDVLRAIEHARVTLVHLGFANGELERLPNGFGYLVPPAAGTSAGKKRAAQVLCSDTPLALGTIFASNLFEGRAPRGCSAVSSFYRSADVDELSAVGLVDQACADLAHALGLHTIPRPRVVHTQTWSDVIPHYAPGHADRMRTLLSTLERHARGLHLAGSYTSGVSVDQVIARGRAVAREIGALKEHVR